MNGKMRQSGQISTPLMLGLAAIGAAGLAGAAYLALGSNSPASDKTTSTETVTTETSGPGAITRTEDEALTTSETVADLSSGPERPPMPKVIEWQGHYLVLQGENHLPVKSAIATPHVTFFEVEDGYMPISSFSNTDADTACGTKSAETVAEGMAEAGAVHSADEAVAMVGANAQNHGDTRPTFCPTDLGQIWGSGSYVYDDAYNQLAGQEFTESTKILKAAYLWFNESYERDQAYPDDDEVIIILEGGDERAGDPAIKVASFYDSIIIDYPVLKHEGDPPDAPVQGPGETYAPPAPELPVMITYKALDPADYDPNVYQVPIGLLEEQITDRVPETSFEFGPLGEIVIVTRGIRAENEAEGLARAERVHKALRKAHGDEVKIRTVSFGDEVPICADDTRECWSLNRSSIAYFYGK